MTAKTRAVSLSVALFFIAICPSAGPVTAKPRPAAAVPDVEPHIVAWLTIASLNGVWAGLAAFSGRSVAEVRAVSTSELDLPAGLTKAIAPDRPLVVAVVDPTRFGKPGAPPVLLSVPLTDMETGRRELATWLRPAPRGARSAVLVYERPDGGRVYATFEPTHKVAYIAFDPGLAEGAAAALSPRAREPAGATFVVRTAVDRLQRLYGQRVEEVMGRGLSLLASATNSGFAVRGVKRTFALLAGASTLEVRLDLLEVGLKLEIIAQGRGGALGSHVAQQRPGPTWGAELMPQDAVLVYATRASAGDAALDAQELASLVEGAQAGAEVSKDQTARWRTALAALASSLQGEHVYGVWPAAGGGIGIGGAFRVAAPEEARLRTVDAYVALRPVLGRAVAYELGLDPERVSLATTLRRGATRVEGRPVDVVELRPTFHAAAGEKQLFRWLYGDRLTMGLVTVDHMMVYAAGRDWRPRLAALVRAGRGEPMASIVDTPAFARINEEAADRVSLVFVAQAGLAALVTDALRKVSVPAPAQEALFEPFLQAGSPSALIAQTRAHEHAGAATAEVDLFIPRAALKAMGNVGGAFLRVTLAPLFGPPPLPPLPSPPPVLTPPPPGGTFSPADTGSRQSRRD